VQRVTGIYDLCFGGFSWNVEERDHHAPYLTVRLILPMRYTLAGFEVLRTSPLFPLLSVSLIAVVANIVDDEV
jgi:hypothetical protein